MVKMKKNILIVRSVSFQQLDKNLTEIVKRFPAADFQFHLLTHGHGLPQAETYTVLTELIDYQSRQNFSFFHVPEGLKKNRANMGAPYEAIIVPMTNKTGVGFLNVLVMTLRIPTHTIYICNLVSEIQEITKRAILKQMVRSFFFSIWAGVLVLPLAVMILPFICLFLGLRRARGRHIKG
jgi:hypothetical protein